MHVYVCVCVCMRIYVGKYHSRVRSCDPTKSLRAVVHDAAAARVLLSSMAFLSPSLLSPLFFSLLSLFLWNSADRHHQASYAQR